MKADRAVAGPFAAFLILGLVGCATAPAYVPDATTAATVRPVEARRLLKNTHPLLSRRAFEDGIAIKSIKIVADSSLVLLGRNGTNYALPLKDLTVDAGFCCMGSWAVVNLNHQWILWGYPPNDAGLTQVHRIADAIYVARAAALNGAGPAAEAVFQKAAQEYRAAAVKPTLPESARRYKVGAETAVREKRFEDAADLYEEALEQVPWWPEGRFNHALVLGEIGELRAAADEMKRYLQLDPAAANARAAQDKMYEWEVKLNGGG